MTITPNERDALEKIAAELLAEFNVQAPPVPIETMLHKPRAGMWDKVDVNQMSGTFMSFKDKYSPRMSMARLLVRHLVASPWGDVRHAREILGTNEETLRAFARMLIMPREMIQSLTITQRTAAYISSHFEVPEADAHQRLLDLSE